MNRAPSRRYRASVAGSSPSSWEGVWAKSFLSQYQHGFVWSRFAEVTEGLEFSLFSFIYWSRLVLFKRFSGNVRILWEREAAKLDRDTHVKQSQSLKQSRIRDGTWFWIEISHWNNITDWQLKAQAYFQSQFKTCVHTVLCRIITDLSIHGFWYPQRSWNQSRTDIKGQISFVKSKVICDFWPQEG